MSRAVAEPGPGPSLSAELERLGLSFDTAPDLASWRNFLGRVELMVRERQRVALLPFDHSLRVPMTVVMGATELLLESQLDTSQRLAAENVHRSGQELLDVMDRALAEHQLGRSAPPSSGEYRTVPRDAPVLAGRRVLLVEDNAFNRALIERVLEPLGCQVESAKSGNEALRLFRPGAYELVLMDCQMPELDGFAATREMRRRERGQGRVPIVAVTAGTISGTRKKCLDAGMDDFLAKPFALGRLRKKVLDWLLPNVADPVTPSSPESHGVDDAIESAHAKGPEGVALDLSRLQELAREAGSPRIIEELSVIFLDDVEKRLVALGLAARARDQRAYLNVIHAVKGASGNFGAVRMARVAEQSEREAKHGDLSRAEAAVETLKGELFAVRELINSEVFSKNPALRV